MDYQGLLYVCFGIHLFIGAFRRFKKGIITFEIREQGYKFRDYCYREFAKEWCEDHNILFIE